MRSSRVPPPPRFFPDQCNIIRREAPTHAGPGERGGGSSSPGLALGSGPGPEPLRVCVNPAGFAASAAALARGSPSERPEALTMGRGAARGKGPVSIRQLDAIDPVPRLSFFLSSLSVFISQPLCSSAAARAALREEPSSAGTAVSAERERGPRAASTRPPSPSRSPTGGIDGFA